MYFTMLWIILVLFNTQTGFALEKVEIDTNKLSLLWTESMFITKRIEGESHDREFSASEKTWKYQTATYTLESETKGVFSNGQNVIINGNRSVIIAADFDVVVNTTIDVSAVAIGNLTENNHLGGFALASKNCCFVGAGPGAGFTFHGGGHGGVGGGSWNDVTNGLSYGKPYRFFGQLIGGSSGAFVYDSDPGSGGGAILFDINGTLTIGSNGKILANGYSVKDTSYPACSGGSAGGRIAINAKKVVLEGMLSVKGGHGGKTSNYSDFCGDGGGGGVIVIKSYDFQFSNSSLIDLSGGFGLENGTDGVMQTNAKIEGAVDISTTDCTMCFLGTGITKRGSLSYDTAKIGCDEWNITACTFVFENYVHFTNKATVNIKGEHALRIVSKKGDIEISTKFDLSMKGKIPNVNSKTFLGGYHNYNGSNPGPGSELNKGCHGNINETCSYGIWPVLLMGGSSCSHTSHSLAYGGGALELEAKNGYIIVNANISADAYADDASTSCGASGGTVILNAKNVTLKAFVTANGCDGGSGSGDGGVIVSPTKSGKIITNRGNAYGHSKIKPGTVLEIDEEPSIKPPSRPCHLSTATPIVSSSMLSSTKTSSLKETLQTSTYTDQSTKFSASHSHVTPSSSYGSLHSSIYVPEREVVSEKFKQFIGTSVNSSSALNISSNLLEAIESSAAVTRRDTQVIMNVIEQLCNRSKYQPKNSAEGHFLTKNVIKSCSKVAKLSFESRKIDNGSVNLVPRMANNLENLGESITEILKMNETFLVQDDTIALEVTSIDGKFPRERSFPSSQSIRYKNDNVTIPKEVFETTKGVKSVIVVTMNVSSTYNQSYDIKGSPIQAISNILAVRLDQGNLNSLAKPIILRQKVLEKATLQQDERHVLKGGFWDAKSENSPAGWSYAGCSSKQKDGYIETESNHMTSFAVLLSVTKEKIPDHHKTALSLITYIGCGVSLFGLLLTFATFVTLDNLDRERTTIHTNLVIALGIGQVVFLSGINATGNRAACTTVAVLLHYFFTAAFSWMFAEGIHLYKKIVSVFSHGSKTKFYYVIGWGLPVIIVALSAGIRPDGYGTESACWISIKAGLIWAFVAPVVIVIIINFTIMLIVVKILMSSVKTVQVDSKTSQEMNRSVQQVRAGAKAMIILMPILGLSWIFGILAVNEAAIVFQYLFCIFNSLQGLFIFLIHCIGNSEVRSAFRRLHEKHTLSKSVGERSFGGRSTAKKSKVGSSPEILVRRETGSSAGSYDVSRTMTPKTLSAAQISLNSLNSPTPTDFYDKFD